MRELLIAKRRISVAPVVSKRSMILLASFFFTKAETATAKQPQNIMARLECQVRE